MSHCSTILIVFFFVQTAVCQNTRGVSGRVVDADDGGPIPFAHVFYGGTTVGAVTDSDGRFRLPDPPADQVDLVVSMMGYATWKSRIYRRSLIFSEQLVTLSPDVIALGELEVVAARPRAWRRNLIRFEELLFGTSEYGKNCKIVNPEVLQLSFDNDLESLDAFARSPLHILNGALGYRITIYDLKLAGNEWDYRFSGDLRFEDLSPADGNELEKWSKARMVAYAGSARHFLKALVMDRLEEEGFAAYHVARPGQTLTDSPVLTKSASVSGTEAIPGIVSPGISPASRFITLSGALFVQFKREILPQSYYDHLQYLVRRAQTGPTREFGSSQLSWLTLPLHLVEVDTSGIVYTDTEGFPMALHGYWAFERFGAMLPKDYDPD